MPLFEYRRYETVPGQMPRLQARFRDVTLAFFAKHDIPVVGMWVSEVGTTSELYYLLRWRDMTHRERSWGAFQADQEWIDAREKSEIAGPIVARSTNQLWTALPFSPLQ